MTLWEAFIFSERWKNMGSIDLEQQQEQKNKANDSASGSS